MSNGTDPQPLWAFAEILRHLQKLGEGLDHALTRMDTIEATQRAIHNAVVAVQAEQRSTANSTDLKRMESSISLLAAEVHGIGVDVSALRLLQERKPPNGGGA